jgi:hypothetical protein
MRARVHVQLARSKDEFEQAFRLLQKSRRELGFTQPEEGEIWVVKQHALPSSNTIVALEGNQVVGALSLFGENSFQLPLETQADLTAFRENLSGRIAEFSVPAVAESHRDGNDVLLALYHYALCFGSTYCHYDAFVTHVPRQWADRYTKLLSYEPLLLKEKISGAALYRSARDGADFRKNFREGFEATFGFPEKKFFLVAHQSMEADTMDYIFNEKTGLFERLSDIELRILKNIYDHGEFARVLPDRALNLPFKKLPQQPRFPMNCEGYLSRENGKHVNLEVLDVSKDGLKIRTEGAIPPGSYPLTLFIGVMKQAEIIAATVWIDEITHIAGLIVKSGDGNWRDLIEYLERESLKVAA